MKRLFFPRWFSLLFPFLFFCADGDAGAAGNSGDAGAAGGAGGTGGAGSGDPPKPTADELAQRAAKFEADLKRAASERDRANTELKKLNEQLAEFQRKEQERAEAERKAAEEAEAAKLLEEKKYSEAIEIRQKKFNEEIEQERSRVQTLASNFVRADLKAAVASTPNIVPEASEEIARLLADQVGYEIKDGLVVPFVKGADGKSRFQVEEPTQPFTIADLVKEFVSKRAYYLKAATGAGSGSGAGAGEGQGGAGWDIKRAVSDLKYTQEWQQKDPEGFKRAYNAYLAELARQPIKDRR